MSWWQPRWAHAAAGFLILVGGLVWHSVEARLELRASVLAGLRLDAEKRAAAISHFFAERGNEVADLASSAALARYHGRRTIESAIDDGLRAELDATEQSFIRLATDRTIGGSRIYARIALLDGDGNILIDVPRVNARASTAEASGAGMPSGTIERFALDRASDDVVVAAPVVSQGANLGRVVAHASVDALIKHFLRDATAEDRIEFLAAGDGRPLSQARQQVHVPATVLAAIDPGQPGWTSLNRAGGGDQTYALAKVSVEGTPFFLVMGMPENRLFERLPSLGLVLASAAGPVLMLGVAAYIMRRRKTRMRESRPNPEHNDFGAFESDGVLEHKAQRHESIEQQLRLQRVELEQRTLELHRSMARTHQFAMYDHVTGLANRALFRELVRNALARSARSGRSLAVLLLDLDRFKRINDTVGHSAGDQLLREVAGRLQRCLRAADSISRADDMECNRHVSRQGGDEFTILLPDLDAPESAAVVASRIIEALCRPISLEGHEVVCTVSVGISVFPRDGDDADALLKYADAAMYSAKERGRNQFRVYENSLHETAVLRLTLENAMRRGLDAGEFDVHYQPLLDATTGTVISLEALMRWRHPTRGMVPPGEFIPVAEETGLIVPLTRYVLTRVCRQIAVWRSNLGLEIKVAINLSGRTFELSEVGEMIRAALAQNGIPATLLEIELTETVLMAGQAKARAVIEDLKRVGVSLSIDDFGTGYSSLAYLRAFAIDYLKIDRSFVRDIPGDENSETIVRTVIGMAHSLGLQVVAEGVENEAQWQFLHKAGCDVVQGFLFGRPVPTVEIAERLLSDKANSPRSSNVTPIRPYATC